MIDAHFCYRCKNLCWKEGNYTCKKFGFISAFCETKIEPIQKTDKCFELSSAADYMKDYQHDYIRQD